MLYKFLFTFVFILTLAGCGSSAVISTRLNNPIIIDGRLNDWGKALNYIQDEKIGFGASDDSDFLYLIFTSRDRNRASHFLRTGITMFIDSEDNQCTYFGARIKSKNGIGPTQKVRNNNTSENPEQLLELFLTGAEIEIVNKDDEIIDVIPLENNFGIKSSINFDNSQFVFEIQIPLKKTPSTPYAACTAPCNSVQVGIVTGIINHEEMGKTMAAKIESPNGRGGSRGSGAGRRSGSKGGRMGGRGSEPAGISFPQPLKYWVDIKLSK